MKFVRNRSALGCPNGDIDRAHFGIMPVVFFLALAFCVLLFSGESAQAQDETSEVGVDSISLVAKYDSVAQDSSVSDTSVVAANVTTDGATEKTVAEFEKSDGLFLLDRWNAFLLVLFFSAAIVFYTRRAKGGKSLFIRKIPGLEAIEDAVGRATEMGRTVLFIPGIQELDDIQTIAGVTILGRIARITAEYETPLMVPVRYPLVFAGAQETVKQSYAEAGKRDSYQEDTVRYVAGEQFAFTAHVNGWMMREKPAANIYMGGFFAESLLLAENGFASGAIQIAGTAETAQLPFFIVACDYTLIGEELYAASAYLSHEPLLLGGLKGQDLFKATLIVMILLGVVGVLVFPETLGKWLTILWNGKYV